MTGVSRVNPDDVTSLDVIDDHLVTEGDEDLVGAIAAFASAPEKAQRRLPLVRTRRCVAELPGLLTGLLGLNRSYVLSHRIIDPYECGGTAMLGLRVLGLLGAGFPRRRRRN